MLFTSAFEFGPPVEAALSDDTGLGRLEALILGPSVFGSPRASHVVPDCIFIPAAF